LSLWVALDFIEHSVRNLLPNPINSTHLTGTPDGTLSRTTHQPTPAIKRSNLVSNTDRIEVCASPLFPKDLLDGRRLLIPSILIRSHQFPCFSIHYSPSLSMLHFQPPLPTTTSNHHFQPPLTTATDHRH